MKIFNKKNMKIDVLYFNRYSMNIHIKMTKDCDAIFRRFLFLLKAIRQRSDSRWFVNEQLSKTATCVRDILATAKDKTLIHGYVVSATGASITFNESDPKARKRHETAICDPVSQLLCHVVTADEGKISYDPAVWKRIQVQETEQKPRAGRFHVRFNDYQQKKYIVRLQERGDPRQATKGHNSVEKSQKTKKTNKNSKK